VYVREVSRMKCWRCEDEALNLSESEWQGHSPVCGKCRAYISRADAQQLTPQQRKDPVAIRLNCQWLRSMENNGTYG